MAQQIKITQTSNADMNIGVPKTLTAVEWLVDQICTTDMYNIIFKKEIEQAKQMEKEQIINAFDIACEDENRIGEEYYNETYKKQ